MPEKKKPGKQSLVENFVIVLNENHYQFHTKTDKYVNILPLKKVYDFSTFCC